jgi:Toprim domain
MRQNSTSQGSLPSIKEIARVLGGEARGNQALVAGPGHSPKDRSLSIKMEPSAPDGFLVYSFAGDDPLACKDYVREKLGLASYTNGCRRHHRIEHAALKPAIDHRSYADQQLKTARWLWARKTAPDNSPVENYLRGVRGYSGQIPATLGFLPPQKAEHHPAMIAAFALAGEPEPGLLSVLDDRVCGVHLTLLKPDGSGKAETPRNKLTVGPSSGWPIVLAPLNDLLGLVICEGIETGLSVFEATGCGVWVAGSASRMPALADRVPPYVDCVTIAGEADAGRKGAVRLAERLHARGMHSELRFLGDEEARVA